MTGARLLQEDPQNIHKAAEDTPDRAIPPVCGDERTSRLSPVRLPHPGQDSRPNPALS
ncbi:MAG: hypothetical protein R3335_06520 [Anaerolineales bacterium]|nr:hypothetical protein [Anaerolineales bacterium]